MDVKKNNYLFTFLIGVVIGLSLLVVSYAQEPDYQLPTGNSYAVSEVRAVEVSETTIRKAEGKPRTSVVLNKYPTKNIGNGDGQDKETNERLVQPVLVLHNDVATEIANYMWALSPNPVMMASFMQESGLNPEARGAAGEYGICQLMPNKTNLIWINDPRRNDWKRQAKVCIDKWNAVPDPKVIRMSYKSGAYKKYLHYFE